MLVFKAIGTSMFIINIFRVAMYMMSTPKYLEGDALEVGS
jgi:hypothetical protein